MTVTIIIPECSDGVDNDGNSLIDYPDDLGCSGPTDNSEEMPTQCSDSVDNDSDGQIDFPDDIGCDAASDNDETNPPPTGGGGGSGGGGGGGGGGSSGSLTQTSVSFSGLAYPNATVTLLKDGAQAASQLAGPDARFNVSLSGLAGGTYTFSLSAKDSQGKKSLAFSFTVTVTPNVGTLISGIFLTPTIGVDKVEVRRGEPLTIFGSSVPESVVTVSVHSDEEIIKTVISDANGLWSYVLNSFELAMGEHGTQAYSTRDDDISPVSSTVHFAVGNKTVLAPTSRILIGDLNGDGRVNIIDFSIMSYWFKRTLTDSARTLIDLSKDDKVDLIDFSIMAYYWTG